MPTPESHHLSYFGGPDDSYGWLVEALHAGCSPDSRACSDETPLHFASEMACTEFIRLLLDAGADPNARCEWDDTPLCSATIFFDSPETAELLLRAGSDPDIHGKWGETPLYCAARRGFEAFAHRLLEHGANPMIPTREGELPMDVAATVHLRWLLLAAGAEPPKDFPEHPHLLLHPCARELGGCDMLMDAMNDADLQKRWGCTPLHLAALSGSETAVRMLLDAHHEVSAHDADGRPPLYWAVNAARREAAFLLLEYGAEVDTLSFIRAVEQHDTPLLRRMLPLASPEARTCALLRAAELGDAGILRLLIRAGADVNARGSRGQSALHNAAERHAMPAVLLLLEWGADPNAANDEGTTALHIAAERDDESLMRILLEQGAAPTLKDKGKSQYFRPEEEEAEADPQAGRTPLDLCGGNYSGPCRRLLEEALKPPPAEEEEKENDYEHFCCFDSLADAAGLGQLQEVRERLRNGEDPNARDERRGETALHRAMALNCVKTARCLLQHGADPHAEDARGNTPLDGAISHAMRCLLRRHGARLRHERMNNSAPAHES